MEKLSVICKHCKGFTTVRVEKYISHLKNVHKIVFPENVDLIKQAHADKYLISEHKRKIEERKRESEEQNRLWLQEQYEKAEKERELERLRHLEVTRQRQKEIDDNTHDTAIIWDDIVFGKDQIKFDPSRTKTIIKPFPYKGIIESLNLIKAEYFKRLFSKKIYHLAIYKGNIIPEHSPGLNKLFETIEVVKDFHEFKHPSPKVKNRFEKFQGLSNADIIELFRDSIKKSSYLKYLASKQDASLRIIPIFEFLNYKTEEAFLFRFKQDKNTLLLIWENVNDARASHIFAYDISDQDNVLQEIEHFVYSEHLTNKRSALYLKSLDANKLKKNFIIYEVLNMTTFRVIP